MTHLKIWRKYAFNWNVKVKLFRITFIKSCKWFQSIFKKWLFSILKKGYKFKPKIFTLDFRKVSATAIKQNYPNCIIIKCYFHCIQAIFKRLKKEGYCCNDKIIKINELLYNLNILPFLNYKIIKRFYEKLVEKYEKESLTFFKYFEKQWVIKKKLGKYISQ